MRGETEKERGKMAISNGNEPEKLLLMEKGEEKFNFKANYYQ